MSTSQRIQHKNPKYHAYVSDMASRDPSCSVCGGDMFEKQHEEWLTLSEEQIRTLANELHAEADHLFGVVRPEFVLLEELAKKLRRIANALKGEEQS